MKRIKVLALLLIIALALGGCRFAREDAARADEDRLVGVSLRAEIPGEPDGYDEEGNPYWSTDESGDLELTQEQLAALVRGEDISIDAPAREIGPYAVYVVREDDGTGIRTLDWPGHTRAAINVTDEGTEYRIEATAYVCDERLYNENSYNSIALAGVYQRPDGSLYAQSAGGVGGMIGSYTLTLSEERTVSDGKESKAERLELAATVEKVDRLVSARLLAFDASHALLAATELDLAADELEGAVPDGAAYLLLEEESVDAEGAPHLARRTADLPLSDPEAPVFTLYVPGADGLARPTPLYAR